MTFINYAPIDEDGAVIGTSDDPTPEASRLGGFAYDATGALFIIDGAPPAGHPYLSGFRFTPEGSLYVWSAESDGDPPDTVGWNGGLPVTYDGRLVITSESPTHWVGGWPLAANGWVCMSGGEPPPPTPVTFDNVRFYFPDGFEPTLAQIGQLYFGSSGTITGLYTNKVTFLAEHPGLTLQDLSGIAPPGGQAAVPGSFPGFSQAPGGTGAGTFAQMIDDSAFLGTPFCVWEMAGTDCYLQLTFSPVINSFGFNWDGALVVEWRNGGTVLQSYSNVGGGSIGTQFVGYSSATGVVSNAYQQESNTDLYRQEVSADPYIQE